MVEKIKTPHLEICNHGIIKKCCAACYEVEQGIGVENGSVIFRAEECHKGRWMAIGYVDGDEVWCDGCVVQDRVIAERIAVNMRVAFEAGVKWTQKRVAALSPNAHSDQSGANKKG